MMDTDPDINAFVRWFQSSGGLVDTNVMGITEFPSCGRGAIALCDIPEGHTLFTLPRTITFSTRTSPLPALFGLEAWHAHGLHKGWVGLILCMMWEDAWAHELDTMNAGELGQVHIQAKWSPYMRVLPTLFDTPMFWTAEELEELKGTSVIDKIGRDDAERAYTEQILPAIRTSSTLFPPCHAKWYTLDAYHRAGSRILSRSFTVSRWTNNEEVVEDTNRDGESDEDEVEAPHPGASAQTANIHPSACSLDDIEVLDSVAGDDEEDDPSDVAMVPMADLLNARWGSENAKLFYEPLVLRMVTTKDIKQGEQIFNTYGDPPNSDLLRCYGHVDLVQLHFFPSACTVDAFGDVEMKDGTEGISHLGNPSDIAEIRADLVVHVVQTTNCVQKTKDMHARIEWWLDEGEDDTFMLTLPESVSHLSVILPPALISLTRLLVLSESDFKSAHSKRKLPKGKLKKGDIEHDKILLEILDTVFKQREDMYIGGSTEDDERLLSLSEALTVRKRHAVIVRLGEKRVIRAVREGLRKALGEIVTSGSAGSGNHKSGSGRRETGRGSTRKRVVNGEDADRGWKKARKS